ncbi:MAG: type IX secretion system outer membrane channel protein PorV [Flavobacteriales bacterium]|nr:type IX secretion system outer membrane channel protein PorV [Flavobacteriales bacterium]
MRLINDLNFPSLSLALTIAFLSGIAGVQAQLTPGEVSQQVQLNTITTAVPFLMIGPDSRSGALGDAGVALSPDANSLHWNPAKMAFSENEVEFSLSYAPWLRALVDDMNLAYLTGVKRINNRQAWGAALRYFSLGNITFTDETGTTIRDFQPAEFSLDVGYSQKLSNRFSGGIAGRFINSNLTGGTNVLGANSKPGRSVAVDVSVFYSNPRTKFAGRDAAFNWGVNISNIGAKMSYSESADRDFIPTNLKMGTALKMMLDDYNSLTFTIDANKLLVPTTPIYEQGSGSEIVSGFDPNVGVASAMIQSFYDAPGIVNFNEDGTYTIEDGSVFREELREFNMGGGIEYLYNDVFAFRTGFFNEHYSKGARQFITLGAGIKYTVFTVDLSYLISTRQQNPLANTLRFTLRLQFADMVGGSNDSEE